MFIIRLANGREVHETDGDQLSVNHDTGVVTISRVDGFEEVTTRYSPTAWETAPTSPGLVHTGA
jgi:hypothetical protein